MVVARVVLWKRALPVPGMAEGEGAGRPRDEAGDSERVVNLQGANEGDHPESQQSERPHRQRNRQLAGKLECRSISPLRQTCRRTFRAAVGRP